LKRIVFIVNPASGVFSKENLGEIIQSKLDLTQYAPEIKLTEGPGHATDICRQQIQRGTEVVVAVGGDGSVNEVARGITGSEVAMGIIPAGSGNGLAHHLKIPISRKNAIDVINKGHVIKIDTGMVNDRLFVSIAGIGFDGLVAKRFEHAKLRGFVGYLRMVAEEYPKYAPRKYRLEFDDQVINTRALFIAFANSDQFGFNTSIAPGAKIDDGLLDVVIVDKPQIIDLPILASLLYWRRIEQSKYITIIRTRELKIYTRSKRWINIDGDPGRLGGLITVGIRPLSLNVIVP
jgi:YegS/Rv2252/BmrU family lipid kinase